MTQIFAISRLALLESVRNRVFTGLLVFLLLFLGFAIYVSTLSLGEVSRFIQNAGMAGMSLTGLSVVILFGLYSLYQEQDRYELYVLLIRVSRPAYLAGRFLGSVWILGLFSLIAGIGVFGVTWAFGHIVAPLLFWSVYWTVMEFALVAAVGILFYAMGIGFTLNALLLLAVYAVGHSLTEAIQSFIGLGVFGNPYHLQFVKILSHLFPNFDVFNFRLAIIHGDPLNWGRIGLSTLYGICYTTAVLSLAGALISRRDIA
jgi:ABC-type transport system involved in multi-copper enzyme maturation permease subunit